MMENLYIILSNINIFLCKTLFTLKFCIHSFILNLPIQLKLFSLNYSTSYNFLFLFIFLLFLFCSVLLGLSFLLSPKLKNIEKNSPYECGFNPFEDTRSVFEIHFYKVAILFIIFDLEIAFLLPWVLIYNYLSFFGYWIITFFLFVLILGFIYELMTGSLDWE